MAKARGKMQISTEFDSFLLVVSNNVESYTGTDTFNIWLISILCHICNLPTVVDSYNLLESTIVVELIVFRICHLGSGLKSTASCSHCMGGVHMYIG